MAKDQETCCMCNGTGQRKLELDDEDFENSPEYDRQAPKDAVYEECPTCSGRGWVS